MAPSQLKQLKSSIQTRRTQKASAKQSSQPRRPPANGVQKKKPRPKSLGEEQRKSTLLKELQSRHKVGGIVDRRIGENNPSMAPEDRMLQRYARQRSKRDSMFNLEDDEAGGEDAEEALLTHGGRSIAGLATDDIVRDDFDVEAEGLADDDDDELFTRPTKKRRLSEEIAEMEAKNAAELEESGRKKSKKEVMEEVIAKSKLYKYERQQTKEDDEAIRAKLDQGLPDLMALLRGVPAKPPPPVQHMEPTKPAASAIHPDRLAFMDTDEAKAKQAEKEYDKRLRQLAMDTRAAPTERTKTEEERVKDNAQRLKELEDKRLRRMKGEEESEVEKDYRKGPDMIDEDEQDDEDEDNEAAEFGLDDVSRGKKAAFDVEDEDEFIIDEDLVASGSDVDEDFDEDDEDEDEEAEPDDDSEFLADVLHQDSKTSDRKLDTKEGPSHLAYTYPCPQNHAQFLDILKGISDEDMPVVIQRIRALYHPQLNAQNKEKLSLFATALVDHVAYMGSQGTKLNIVETVIRHVHSLSRTYPESIGSAFRAHLGGMHERGTLEAGDLIILTAIGSIYPTSDHFHQVVTPAVTIMARWLGMNTPPKTPQDLTIGVYVVALALNYQTFSKRFMPETVRFTLATLTTPNHPTKLLQPHLANLGTLLDLYTSLPSFPELFQPFLAPVRNLSPPLHKRLSIALHSSLLARRPLQLHNHRPLPIKSSIPKFEDSFDPTKHYDPDRERADASKLKAEYKRERKGALRELKKDASFLAREGLKRRKATDEAQRLKERRLIAEIQGTEGMEGNKYEREKGRRKGRK
jgi:nucleolar protein 14